MSESLAPSPRAAWQIVACALVAYALGMIAFYPTIPSIRDEVKYLEQAQAFSRGVVCYEQVKPVTNLVTCPRPANYLPGTASLMLPFVAATDWRAGWVVPLLCVLLSVWIMGLWLSAAGRSPLFALMLLAYPSFAVFGRIAMSDPPSTLFAVLGLWLFWTGGPAAPGRWFAAGVVASLSVVIRDTNVLVFAAFFLGALLRHRVQVWPIVVGGLLALWIRPVSTWVVFGDPFFTFPHGPTFGLGNILPNALVYGIAVLVYLPAGLFATLAYRGERRPELMLTVLAILAMYSTFGYSGETSGFAKQLLLGPRYLMPMTPLIIFACAEVFPRWWHALAARFSDTGRQGLVRWTRVGVRAWAAGICVAAFALHPAFAAFSETQSDLHQVIYSKTPDQAVIVLNTKATRKHVNRLYGGRRVIARKVIGAEELLQILEHNGEFYAVFIDRSGSALLQEDAARNQRFADLAGELARTELLHDGPGGPGERLRIWRVRPRSGGADSPG